MVNINLENNKMRQTLHIFIFLFILLIVQNLSSQTTTKQIVGSEKYIDLFNRYAEKIGIDDLRLNNDSLRIRIWDGGKLLDLKIIKDSIYVQKIIYMFTNHSYKRDPKRNTIISKKIEITKEQKMSIGDNIKQICLNSPLRKNLDIGRDSFYMNNSSNTFYVEINQDSIALYNPERRLGGIVRAIEFSDNEIYLWSSWLTNSQAGSTIKNIMEDLDMEKEETLLIEKLPKGTWYSFGGTTAIYKVSFWEHLYRSVFGW